MIMGGRYGGDYVRTVPLGMPVPPAAESEWEECNICECDRWAGCTSTQSAQYALAHLPDGLPVLYLGQVRARTLFIVRAHLYHETPLRQCRRALVAMPAGQRATCAPASLSDSAINCRGPPAR